MNRVGGGKDWGFADGLTSMGGSMSRNVRDTKGVRGKGVGEEGWVTEIKEKKQSWGGKDKK